ncbi:MAG: hypothetical protein JXQ99_22640 [Hyphomicrobiaceae bacterium]
MKRLMISAALAVALVSGPAMAEWKPKGPIKLWIGFGAGGGTDTQGRAIAEAIEKLKGWRIIPENNAGAGGISEGFALVATPAAIVLVWSSGFIAANIVR